MENQVMNARDGMRNDRRGYLARVNLFWLVVGGLMIFFGIAAILRRAGIWSAADADNAGDAVIVLLGIAAIVHALDVTGTRRGSA